MKMFFHLISHIGFRRNLNELLSINCQEIIKLEMQLSNNVPSFSFLCLQINAAFVFEWQNLYSCHFLQRITCPERVINTCSCYLYRSPHYFLVIRPSSDAGCSLCNNASIIYLNHPPPVHPGHILVYYTVQLEVTGSLRRTGIAVTRTD